jgi:hypothetical protein
MKLIFCPLCQDVIKLTLALRYCQCGESHGYYLDDINAQIGGKAIPLGFMNYSLAQAIKRRPETGQGQEFTAFVIPRNVSTIIKEDWP